MDGIKKLQQSGALSKLIPFHQMVYAYIGVARQLILTMKSRGANILYIMKERES